MVFWRWGQQSNSFGVMEGMNSLSKNQLKNLAAYRLQKRCDEDEVFVVEGVKMCNEALMSDFTIRTLCGTAEYINSVNDKLTRCGEIYEVTAEQLERLSNQRTPNKVWMIVERRTENGERKTENGERRTENGKRGTENGKRRTADAGFGRFAGSRKYGHHYAHCRLVWDTTYRLQPRYGELL